MFTRAVAALIGAMLMMPPLASLAQQDTDPRVSKATEVIGESANRIAAYIRELAHVVAQGKQQVAEESAETEPVTAGR